MSEAATGLGALPRDVWTRCILPYAGTDSVLKVARVSRGFNRLANQALEDQYKARCAFYQLKPITPFSYKAAVDDLNGQIQKEDNPLPQLLDRWGHQPSPQLFQEVREALFWGTPIQYHAYKEGIAGLLYYLATETTEPELLTLFLQNMKMSSEDAARIELSTLYHLTNRSTQPVRQATLSTETLEKVCLTILRYNAHNLVKSCRLDEQVMIGLGRSTNPGHQAMWADTSVSITPRDLITNAERSLLTQTAFQMKLIWSEYETDGPSTAASSSVLGSSSATSSSVQESPPSATLPSTQRDSSATFSSAQESPSSATPTSTQRDSSATFSSAQESPSSATPTSTQRDSSATSSSVQESPSSTTPPSTQRDSSAASSSVQESPSSTTPPSTQRDSSAASSSAQGSSSATSSSTEGPSSATLPSTLVCSALCLAALALTWSATARFRATKLS